MQHKTLYLFGLLCLIQVSRGSDDCSWSDEERALDCCTHKMTGLPEDVVKKCAEENGVEPTEVPVDHYIPCVEECILKMEGFLTDDNKINVEKFTTTSKPENLEHCVKEQATWSVPEGKCTSGGHLFSHCMDVYEYMHCSGWKESDECKATREKLTRCYDNLLMPPSAIGLKAK